MKTTLRKHARLIFRAALSAASAREAVLNNLSLTGNTLSIAGTTIDLKNYKKIIVVGAGKAGAAMGTAVEQVLGDRIVEGCLVVKEGHVEPLQHITLYEAAHPIPDAQGEVAGHEIARLLADNAVQDTLFLCLISGGASALLISPAEGISLEDKQRLTNLLLASGADIVEINTIRKYF